MWLVTPKLFKSKCPSVTVILPYSEVLSDILELRNRFLKNGSCNWTPCMPLFLDVLFHIIACSYFSYTSSTVPCCCCLFCERRKFEFHIGQLGLPTRLILITPIARDIASPRFIFIPIPPFLSKLTNIKATIINSVRSSLRYDSPLCGTLNYPQNSEALVLTF